MKTERFSYLYLLFGVWCGFLVGSTVGQETALIVRRMLFALAILFIAFSWRWIERRAHQKHLESWEEIKAAGKWKFVLTQYLLFRGGVLFALVVLPALTTLQLHGTIIAIMALSAGLLGAILVFFGLEEWNECKQEEEILLLRQTGEFIVSQQN